MFGKKKSATPPEPPSPPPGGDGDGGASGTPLPWAGWPDEIGCNLAGGHLVGNLQIPLTVDGRIHAETLMTAAGAVAGWGAQKSLVADHETLTRADRLQQISIAEMKDGRRMMFGDALNGMLVSNDPATAPRCIWNNLAGTAIAHGLDKADLPDLNGMFAHISRELGGPREGLPSTPPEHQPHAPAGQLLERVLPVALSCLTGEISDIASQNGFRAEQTSYQAVTAWSAAKLLSQCCSVLAPKMALIIGMEAAIYASKLMSQPAQQHTHQA